MAAQRERMSGLRNVRRRRDDALSRVGWDRLEVLLAEHYRSQGWRVEHVGTGASGTRFDGGIDLKLRRGDAYVVVQCKHWNAKQVPHNDVHQLLGIMVNESATGAILATSGEFTRYARESAAKSGSVELVDGDALRAMLGPLPELDATRGVDYTTTLAAQVGERLLSATEDRIRYGGGLATAGHRVANVTVSSILLKVGLFVLFGWFAVVVMGHALDRSLSALKAPSKRVAHRIVDPAPATPDTRLPTASVASANNTNPCHEIIDWQSGTYIDHCAKITPHKQPTTAEIRESRRKADEAAAILAPNVPEM